MEEAKSPAKAKSKPPAIAYAQVAQKAKALVDSGKLTHAWIEDNLQVDDKKPSDFDESELTQLDRELDEFMKAFETANKID